MYSEMYLKLWFAPPLPLAFALALVLLHWYLQLVYPICLNTSDAECLRLVCGDATMHKYRSVQH